MWIYVKGKSVKMDPTDYDTIVVGLGAAGVKALTELARAGRCVLGLEAADRIGGRVYTKEFAGGKVELGAEWIHGTENNVLYDIAKAYKIEVVPQDLEFTTYRSDGNTSYTDITNDLLLRCVVLAETRENDAAEPLGQYLRREIDRYIASNLPHLLTEDGGDFIEEFKHFMNLLTNNYESSNDWDDVTTDSKYVELDGNQHVSWHRYGYSTLFGILMNTYNNGPGLPNLQVKLNSKVSNIQHDAQPHTPVYVTTADGTRYSARHVIVTVSLGVLKKHHSTLFTPPLPQRKVDSINNIAFGVMDKVILSFAEPWWPKHTMFFGFVWKGADKRKVSKEDYWTTRVFGASRSMGSSHAITLWTSGDVGRLVETLPEDQVKRQATQLLRQFMGENVPEPTGIVRSTWASNPLTLGSYSYDDTASPNHPDARLHLAEPILDSASRPRILFAGEATNSNHFSTVHGAIETGMREVDRLLSYSTKSKL